MARTGTKKKKKSGRDFGQAAGNKSETGVGQATGNMSGTGRTRQCSKDGVRRTTGRQQGVGVGWASYWGPLADFGQATDLEPQADGEERRLFRDSNW